jgi:hypothetical protein
MQLTRYVVDMKRLYILVILLFLFFGHACKNDDRDKDDDDNDNGNEDIMAISEIAYTTNQKAYFLVEGKPYVILGGQIRLDGLVHRGTGEHAPPEGAPSSLTMIEIEKYIEEAKAFGLNTVQIPIDWSLIELSYDTYDFMFFDAILDMIKRHDMRMELLWFSTNMVGDSHGFHLPAYIWNNPDTYPRMTFFHDNVPYDDYFSWMYGRTGYLVLDHENLMRREAKVIKEIMDHLASWKEEHDYAPIIGIQVHNEPDNLLRWRIDQRELEFNGQKISKERAWEMTLTALDHAGQAFRHPEYSVVTRTNMTVSLSSNPFLQAPFASPLDVLALEGIDIVGDDPYVENPLKIKEVIESYSTNGNYPHIAENMGNYPSTPAMILTAVKAGGSYAIYDFATPPFFTWMNEYYGSSYQMDQGIVNPDFTDKPHSELTRNVLKGIRDAMVLFALSDPQHIVGFNIEEQTIPSSYVGVKTIDNLTMTFSTESQAIGFAIRLDDQLIVYATSDAVIAIDGYDLAPYAYVGYYLDDQTFVETDKRYPSGKTLNLIGQDLYVFKLMT